MAMATVAVRRNQNLYRSRPAMRLGPVSVKFVTIAVIAVLALLYLTQITKTSVYGYKVSELAQKREKILADKQELEVEAARLQSVQHAQASPGVKNMVPEKQVTYARP